MTEQTTTIPAVTLEKRRAVSWVLWQILLLNLLVAASKMIVGVMTGTIAIIADGLHSSMDGASNVIGLVAQRIAVRPPDKDHPYGHSKFETIATLGIGGLLMVTAWELLKVAFERLRTGNVPQIGVLQFAVLIVTLFINIGVATYERWQARHLESDLLAADADHTLSDVWVTLSVIASLVAVKLGLQWMDALAALVIVAFIAFTAWGIVRKTTTVLVDAAPIAPEALTQAISGTPGVQRVLRARSRGTRDAVYIDLDVQVAPVISTGFAYNIADAVRERVKQAFPHASEVQIQISPDTDGQPGYLTAARAAADALALGVHEIIGISTPAGKILEMHVEVPPGMTLREAHNRANELESRILQQTDIVEVVTHIEPAASGHSLPTHSPEALQIQDEAMMQLAGRFPQAHWHHASIYRNGYGFAFSAHCHLPGDISLETAHHIAEEAELFLRSKFAQLHRVTIHTEPQEGS